MKSKTRCFLFSAVIAGVAMLAAVPQTRADDSDILSAVPADAWGTLTIRNLAEFDKKIIGVSQKLNQQPMSLLALAKGMLGLVSGVNDGGTVALVMMPVQNIMMAQEGLAIFIPVTDFGEMTSMLQPTDAGEGITKIMLAGQEGYCAQRAGFAVIAQKPELVKQVLAADTSTGIRSAWTQHQLDRFAADDITLWLNLKTVFANPMITGMLQMMSQGQANLGDLQAFESVSIALRVDKSGVNIGAYYGVDDNSRQGKALASQPATDKCLLTGLPADEYILAFGLVGSQAQADLTAQSVDQIAQNPMLAMMGADPDSVKKVTGAVSAMVRNLRGLSFSVSGLTGDTGGIAITKVVTVAGDAPATVQQFSDLVSALSTLMPSAEYQKAIKAVHYKSAVETVEGVSVGHLAVALDQIEGVSADDLAKLQKVMGNEGLLFRIAAVDDTHLVATLGGGTSRLASVINTVKSGAAPLGEDKGIQKIAKTLRAKRTAEGYFAFDNLMHVASRMATAMGEPVPPQVPQLDAPVAMVSGPVAAGEYQLDISVPMELIVALKDLSMSPQTRTAGTN